MAPQGLREEHADIFSAIREGDILVHHPYESFDGSVERFVKEAANDPQTVAVKMTVYRVGDDTPFVKSLVHAAEAGKQVACVMELKARFDEERNLHWAEALRAAGAHVVFGVKGLKTHGKTVLVVRKEADGLRAYAHVGTGNYHVRTARLYADCGLLTCDPAITSDVMTLFHFLTGHSHGPDCHSLLVAPSTMRKRFLELIHRETELRERGRIIAKMNQLEDPDLIAALIAAAHAGVSIDLIIRGFCCLRPIENIRIRSIIGRFLEHSRIYYFGAAQVPGEGEFYIGSADWMYRNLSKRIEVVTPVTASTPKQRLWEILEICLRDKRQAWILGSDCHYTRDESADDRGNAPDVDGFGIAIAIRHSLSQNRTIEFGSLADILILWAGLFWPVECIGMAGHERLSFCVSQLAAESRLRFDGDGLDQFGGRRRVDDFRFL